MEHMYWMKFNSISDNEYASYENIPSFLLRHHTNKNLICVHFLDSYTISIKTGLIHY